jgi:hypothetical protein
MRSRLVRPVLLLIAVLAAGSALLLLRSREEPALLDAVLRWGSDAGVIGETRHLPFVIDRAGLEYGLVVRPLREGGQPADTLAHVRLRILRPDGTHLIGGDFRLFLTGRKRLFGPRRAWPEGNLTFRPDTTGRFILQVARRESEIRRVRVRIVGPLEGARLP